MVRMSRVSQLNAYLLGALRGATLNAAPEQENKKLFSNSKAQQKTFMTEFDGSKAREMFTVLNLSPTKAYTCDQILNIHTFSLLRAWLDNVYAKHEAHQGDRPLLKSLGGTPKKAPRLEPLTDTFKTGIVEYCLRLLDQSSSKLSGERIASLDPHDVALLQAVPTEVVRIFDILCTLDAVENGDKMILRLFPDVKRLFSRGAQAAGGCGPNLKLTLLQFFVKHGGAIMYDIEPMLTSYFGETIGSFYHHQLTAMETLVFCIDHHEILRSTVFDKYFPNIFKILAWSPRTFLGEFVELLPCLISPSTCVEVLHTILDLPCLSAALEQQQAGVVDATTNTNPLAGAFFQYILRDEGGLGGTIDKLGGMHSLFEGAAKLTRVRTVAQITPILLRSYFLTIATEASYDLVLQVVTVMLERISTLFELDTFQAGIRKVFATQMIVLFQVCHPCLLICATSSAFDANRLFLACNQACMSSPHEGGFPPVPVLCYAGIPQIDCRLEQGGPGRCICQAGLLLCLLSAADDQAWWTSRRVDVHG